MKISDLEAQIAESLTKPLQGFASGYRPRVTLRGAKNRKKQNASAESWSPSSDRIEISFDRVYQEPEKVVPPPSPVADLLRALDRIESKPGYEFISLKWFRDTYLPSQGFEWAREESHRNNALRECTSKGLILTARVHNPKNPEFPVTSIRLNRALPEIVAILGTASAEADFAPVKIRGESLSSTVLRDRR